ncbi:hypothetical protein PCANC_27139 [Puccinia coronata f. sp. avenae]|uniref:Uncharacterized protein n=1 Tax=Puccinia coronata f. sp. avenae TaxID=200324 RepID=A0A2N5S2W4_9BASI|nr:hypothetical protein PCANC_27139 [Puccinia coronata f. sp. avenae]
MSVVDEIHSIKQQLMQLQTRLKALESTFASSPSKPSQNARRTRDQARVPPPCSPLVPKVSGHCRSASSLNTSRQDAKRTQAKNNDKQTLRSRSFQVMRHLVNVVDMSQLKDQKPAGRNSITAFQHPPIQLPVKKITNSLSAKLPSEQERQNKPLVSVLSAPDNRKTLVAPRISLFKPIPKHSRLHELIKISYRGLCFPPDNLISSNYAYQVEERFISADKIEKQATKLIRRGLAGVWRWSFAKQAAGYQSLIKKDSPPATTSRYWKYLGWATSNTPGCSPPPICNLPMAVSDKLVMPTWFWHQDRWLLFSVHDS